MARGGRRPGLPRTAAAPPAPRGSVMTATREIQGSQGAPYAAILGLGAYRPSRVIPNSEVIEAIDSSDEWIQQRSGIKQRRWATPEETVRMMSGEAARAALNRCGIDARQIECVIVATVSHLVQTPAVATLV